VGCAGELQIRQFNQRPPWTPRLLISSCNEHHLVRACRGDRLFPSRERHLQRTMCPLVQINLLERAWFLATAYSRFGNPIAKERAGEVPCNDARTARVEGTACEITSCSKRY